MHHTHNVRALGVIHRIAAVGVALDGVLYPGGCHAEVERNEVNFGSHYRACPLVAHGKGAEHDALFKVLYLASVGAFADYGFYLLFGHFLGFFVKAEYLYEQSC